MSNKRFRLNADMKKLIVQLSIENPKWGYGKIATELNFEFDIDENDENVITAKQVRVYKESTAFFKLKNQVYDIITNKLDTEDKEIVASYKTDPLLKCTPEEAKYNSNLKASTIASDLIDTLSRQMSLANRAGAQKERFMDIIEVANDRDVLRYGEVIHKMEQDATKGMLDYIKHKEKIDLERERFEYEKTKFKSSENSSEIYILNDIQDEVEEDGFKEYN